MASQPLPYLEGRGGYVFPSLVSQPLSLCIHEPGGINPREVKVLCQWMVD